MFSVWAGSSAWLGALTLRIERPPYTRKSSHEGRRVGSSNLPRPTRIAWLLSSSPLLSFLRRTSTERLTSSALLILWLVQFHINISRHSKASQQSPPLITDARSEFYASRLQFFNRFVDVIANRRKLNETLCRTDGNPDRPQACRRSASLRPCR